MGNGGIGKGILGNGIERRTHQKRVHQRRRPAGRSLVILGAAIASLAAVHPKSAWASNVELDVVNGQTDLTSPTTYGGTAPTTSSDVTFTAGTAYAPATFTVGSNLAIGTINDKSTTALAINNSTGTAATTLTLSGGGNSVSGTSADLLFSASGASLTVTGGSGATALGVALGSSGNFDAVGTANVSSVISDGGSGFGISKIGTGTLLLSGANTFSGGMTLSAGTLSLAGIGTGTSGSPTAGAVGTGTFTLAAGTLTESAAATIFNNITVATGSTVAINSNTANLSLAGSLSGGGTINESGTNTGGTHFSGNNSGFTGSFNSASNGSHRVRFDNVNSGSAAATWTLNNTAGDGYGFAFGTGTISFGSLAGNGVFRNDGGASTATMSVGALNTDTTFSGSLVANGTAVIALAKVGTGKLTLSTANAFTGATTVSNGTLQLGNAGSIAASNSVTVNGGTLSTSIPSTTSTVNLGGNVSLSSGMISADGSGVGSFTLTGASKTFTMSSGTLAETIASATSFDTIAASATTDTFTITGGSLDLSSSTGIDYTQSYPILSGFGASSSVAGLTITGYDTTDFTATLSNAGVLSFTAVPEPASFGLIALGMLAVTRRRRRNG